MRAVLNRTPVDKKGRGVVRARGTHPLAPPVLLAGLGLTGLAVMRPWLIWVALAGIAGYSLSGSVWSYNSALTLLSPVRWGRSRILAWRLAAFGGGLVMGALLSGAALALLSGIAAPVPDAWAVAVLLALVAVLLLRDLGVIRLRLPENRRQVPQSILHRTGLLPAFQFGAELGTGVRTYAPAAAPLMLAFALVLLEAGWPAIAVAALGFAFGRFTMPIVRLASGDVDSWDAKLRARATALVASSGVLAAGLVAVQVVTA